MDSNDETLLSFLLSGTCNVVPPSYIKLRSYLNIYLSNIADERNLNLPKNFRNRNKSCPYCYSSWSSDTTCFKLLPAKKSKHRWKRNEKDKEDNQGSQVKESRNTLVLKCKVCTNKSLFSLVKKRQIKKVVKEETVKVKKKKKRKDKSCGLFVKYNKCISGAEVSKKEKRLENAKQNKHPKTVPKHPQNKISESSKTAKDKSINPKNKKLVPNPFAVQSQGKLSRRKDKKLQNLKNAIKGEKSLSAAKKTLQDFLTLI